MKKLKELIKRDEVRWINVFLRDIFLFLCLAYVNYRVDYNSWWVAALTGMLLVLTTWHFSDFLEEQGRLGCRSQTYSSP